MSTWGTAGILAGSAGRLGGYQCGDERKVLTDALVFFLSLEDGFGVLSGNARDFNLLNQLIREGRNLLYQASLV